MQQQRKQISMNPRWKTIPLALLFVVAPPLVFIFQDKQNLGEALFNSLWLWLLAGLLILFYATRDRIEYDGDFFYILSWKGLQKASIPVTSISSLIHSRFACRFFYNLPNGKKGHFYLYPNGWFYPNKMARDLKKSNPSFFTSIAPLKGFEFLFFRNEEWYK